MCSQTFKKKNRGGGGGRGEMATSPPKIVDYDIYENFYFSV